MAINKNFVVKNGFEVNNNLIYADADTNKVGVGSTGPRTELDVRGGIAATDIRAVGVVTFDNTFYVGSNGNVFTALGIGGSVGVGTNLPDYLLDVRSPVSTGQTAIYVQGDGRFTGDVFIEGDLFVDDITFDQADLVYLNVTGFGTVSSLFVPNVASIKIGIVTDISGTNLNYSGVGTITDLSGSTLNYTGISTLLSLNGTNISYSGVGTISDLSGSTLNYTGSSTLTDISGTNLNYSGISTISSLTGTDINYSGFGTFGSISATDINISGVSTLGTVQISSGIITATSGIVTYYGDGAYLQNISAGIGIGTTGGLVGYGVTFINFYGPGISTVFYDNSTGIATAYFQGGGGGGGAVSIGTVPPTLPSNGDLWYSVNYGRTFVYYDEVVLGIGSTAVWVDAAPFNVGIITASLQSLPAGTALSPSLAFFSDPSTGLYSPSIGHQEFVSVGNPILNINPSGVNIAGITTLGNKVKVGVGTTALIVEGDARVTGILTVGSSSITLDGTNNIINVGTGLTLSSSGINAGIITATSFSGDGSGLTGVGVGTQDSINTTGIITATTISANEFIGTGDKLIFSPTATSFSPADGATGVNALSSPNISITYNQPVSIGTTGNITLRTVSAAGTITESFAVGVSTRATVSGQTLTIDPTNNFDYDQEYYVVVPQGAIKNYVGGNSSLLETYNFTTEAGPVITSFNPADGATGVVVGSNIVLTFDKNIRAGVGTITLRTVSAGGTITESYDVTSSGRLTFSTNTLTIDPTANLALSTNYYVVVPNDAVAGYAGTNTYDFTTENVPPLGCAYEGGFLICCSSPTRWVVAPSSSQVSRNWYSRNDANTTAQSVSGCTGWFVPTCGQLQNPGYTCRTYWDSYSSTSYWSSTENDSSGAWYVNFSGGTTADFNKTGSNCVRAFRCVTY